MTKDQAETSLLLELISARYEHRSILITANQPLGEWNRVFPDPAMTLAAADRLVHHATIFEMNVESYRRRTALEGIRLSLAGAQDELAVIVDGDSIALAKDGQPTTHILKPVIQALEGTVENEYFCMRLAARLKLPVPHVEIRLDGATAFLLVERYDRTKAADGIIKRLHQEDFCQALRVPPELKYEAEGGPGTERSLRLIDQACGRPVVDRLQFIRMLIFHYLVGNADAHGKNYALLYSFDEPDLAPIYDVVCTAVYLRLSKRLAMKIGGRDVPDTIQLKHWNALVPETKSSQRMLVRDLTQMAERIVSEADALVAELAGEEIRHPILSAICKVISSRAGLLQGGAEQVSKELNGFGYPAPCPSTNGPAVRFLSRPKYQSDTELNVPGERSRAYLHFFRRTK